MYMNSYWKQKERLRAKAKKNIEMIIKGETKQIDLFRCRCNSCIIKEVVSQVNRPTRGAKASNCKIEKALQILGFNDTQIKLIQDRW